MSTRTPSLVVPALVGLLCPGSAASAQKIYWCDPGAGTIQRTDLDGSNVEIIVHRFWPEAVAVDPVEQKVYWVDAGSRKRIQRANYDGSGVEDVVTAFGEPRGVTIDVVGRRLYWSDAAVGEIRHSALDGSSARTIVTGLAEPWGLAIDNANDQLYWAEYEGDRVGRSNLDGTNVETVVEFDVPRSVLVDEASARVYWVGAEPSHFPLTLPSEIMSANRDGSDVRPLFADQSTSYQRRPGAILLDPVSRKLYWTNRTSQSPRIERANLDGTELEAVADVRGSGLAIDAASRLAFVTEARPGQLKAADIELWSAPSVVHSETVAEPTVIALDHTNRYLYWVQQYPRRGLFRCRLDGSEVTEVDPAPANWNRSQDLAVDPDDGVLYWVDGGCICDVCFTQQRLRRMAVDGSSAENITPETPRSYLAGVSIDPDSNEYYLLDAGGAGFGFCDAPEHIIRGALDGSQFEVLYTFPVMGLFYARDLDLDPLHRSIYGTMPLGVWRVPMDGDGEKEWLVVSSNDEEEIDGVAVDPVGGKVYWTVHEPYPYGPTAWIYRANLDGTQAEVIVTIRAPSTRPTRIVLDRHTRDAGACCDFERGVCQLAYRDQCTLPERLWTRGATCDQLDPPCRRWRAPGPNPR